MIKVFAQDFAHEANRPIGPHKGVDLGGARADLIWPENRAGPRARSGPTTAEGPGELGWCAPEAARDRPHCAYCTISTHCSPGVTCDRRELVGGKFKAPCEP